MRSRSAVLLILATTLSLALGSGCSFMFVKGPPAAPAGQGSASEDCTESLIAPALDIASAGGAGVLHALSVAGMIADSDCVGECTGRQLAGMLAAITFAVALPFVLSAVYGTKRVHRCQEYHERQRAARPGPAATQPFLPATVPASTPTTR
jgi:hypothetical protein